MPAGTEFRLRTSPLIAGPALLSAGLLLAGLAAASGTGFALSYAAAPIAAVPSEVDIIGVTTAGVANGNLTGTFQVSGQINLTTEADNYAVYFDGTGIAGAVAWITYTDDPADGTLYNSTLTPPVNEPVSLSADGSTMTFTLPVGDVGSASDFAVNVFANHDGSGTNTSSWLGTTFPSGQDTVCNDATLQCVPIATGSPGGGGSSSGSSSTASTPSFGGAALYATVAAVAVVAVSLVVVVLRRRSRRGRPPSTATGAQPPPPPN